VKLDPRVHAYRTDLAAAELRGKVEAARFVEGELLEIIGPRVPLCAEPHPEAAWLTEALFGERIIVYETDAEGWAWGQLQRDRYVGWLSASRLGPISGEATHRVTALRTLGFPAPDIKRPPLAALPLGAEIIVTRSDGTFVITDAGLYVPTSHVAPIGSKEPDFVAVAERFLGAPYLWGGKTSLGIDCSGLVQVALQAAGIECPRDSDMQAQALGAPIEFSKLERGDLVFWKGHVAIGRDPLTLLHANAHHMMVAIEPIDTALERIGKPAVVKRL
jgi:cell wall-associated NlpC family hydrolase